MGNELKNRSWSWLKSKDRERLAKDRVRVGEESSGHQGKEKGEKEGKERRWSQEVRERERKEELVDQLSSEPPRLNSPLLQSFLPSQNFECVE